MPRFLQFLFDNPVMLFLLVAWVAGAIGNIAKTVRKGRSTREQQRRMPSASPPPRVARANPAERSPEEVAAEMRRILGLDPTPGRAKARPVVTPARSAPPPPLPERSAALSSIRRLDLHEASHVGEGMQSRHLGTLGRAGSREQNEKLGTLGGRVHKEVHLRAAATRFPLTDLKRIIVLNEILGPPLALRGHDERGHGERGR